MASHHSSSKNIRGREWRSGGPRRRRRRARPSLRSGKPYSELDLDALHAMLAADGQKTASNETHRPDKQRSS